MQLNSGAAILNKGLSWEDIQGGKVYGTEIDIGAETGDFAHIAMYNPTGSGKLIKLVRLIIYSNTSTFEVSESIGTTVGALDEAINYLENGPSAVARFYMNSDTNVPSGPFLWRSVILNNYSSPMDEYVLLQPGQSADIVAITADVDLITSFLWKEEAI